MKLLKEIATLASGIALAFGVVSGAHAGNTTIVSGTLNGASSGYGTSSGTTVTYYQGSGSITNLSNYAASTWTLPSGTFGAGGTATNALNAKPFGVTTWGLLPAVSGQTPNWIAPFVYTSNDQSVHNASGLPTGYYAFTKTYTLAPGQTTFTLTGDALSASGVTAVLLNGSTTGVTLSPAGSTPYLPSGEQTFSVAGSSTGGTATLTFIVSNTATPSNTDPAGLLGLEYSGTFVPEPATIVAFLIAMLGIAGLMIKNRKGQFTTTLA